MPESKATSKVYIEIVNQIRQMIKTDELKPGDKLPSERELSERLSVGRSSVREALRALELLGLIETRRGEGTFLRDFGEHQLIELLSTFILQDEKAMLDVQTTKSMIEIDCIRLVISKGQHEKLSSFEEWVNTHEFNDDEFFRQVILLSDNRLIYRIWLILKEYYNVLHHDKIENSKKYYLQLLLLLKERDEEKAITFYKETLRNLSKIS